MFLAESVNGKCTRNQIRSGLHTRRTRTNHHPKFSVVLQVVHEAYVNKYVRTDVDYEICFNCLKF
jgi:hypothetical protein